MVLSAGAACGIVSVSVAGVGSADGRRHVIRSRRAACDDGLPLVVWCRFGMVSAALLTDGHSSAAVGLVWRSATHGQRSASGLAKFPKVITAGWQKNLVGSAAL